VSAARRESHGCHVAPRFRPSTSNKNSNISTCRLASARSRPRCRGHAAGIRKPCTAGCFRSVASMRGAAADQSCVFSTIGSHSRCSCVRTPSSPSASHSRLMARRLETLKGLDGVRTHEHRDGCRSSRTRRIGRAAPRIEATLRKHPAVHGFLIGGMASTPGGAISPRPSGRSRYSSSYLKCWDESEGRHGNRENSRRAADTDRSARGDRIPRDVGIDYERWPLSQRAAANAPPTPCWRRTLRRSSS